MLAIVVGVNTVCLGAVAALWVWWRRHTGPGERATPFAAVLDAAQQRWRTRNGADGEAGCS